MQHVMLCAMWYKGTAQLLWILQSNQPNWKRQSWHKVVDLPQTSWTEWQWKHCQVHWTFERYLTASGRWLRVRDRAVGMQNHWQGHMGYSCNRRVASFSWFLLWQPLPHPPLLLPTFPLGSMWPTPATELSILSYNYYTKILPDLVYITTCISCTPNVSNCINQKILVGVTYYYSTLTILIISCFKATIQHMP